MLTVFNSFPTVKWSKQVFCLFQNQGHNQGVSSFLQRHLVAGWHSVAERSLNGVGFRIKGNNVCFMRFKIVSERHCYRWLAHTDTCTQASTKPTAVGSFYFVFLQRRCWKNLNTLHFHLAGTGVFVALNLLDYCLVNTRVSAELR